MKPTILRLLWFVCLCAILYFALAPASAGGLGGASYHGVAFFILGLLTPAAFPKGNLLLVWLVLLALGGCIEAAQGALATNRVPSWDDFLTDAIAASVGVGYYKLWTVLRRPAAPDAQASADDAPANP